jgi:putative Mg2+ transporter-C (MgtC) family protein
MPNHIGWAQIALRLALTVFAGTVIGINRGEHGRPAGLRTTLLVCLAASISMIQVNLMLEMADRPSDSFVMLDLMRLPLGILSGMGFIGAGAILRKDTLVRGVTTAATLWFVTVIGLCLGSGQLELGMIGLALGWMTLSLLKPLEKAWIRDRRGNLILMVRSDGPSADQLIQMLTEAGLKVITMGLTYEAAGERREFLFSLKWEAKQTEPTPPPILNTLAVNPTTLKLIWEPAPQLTS